MSNQKKILITGATGKIAEAIARILKAETDYSILLQSSTAGSLVMPGWAKFFPVAITDLKGLKSVCYDEKPDIIVNTAGFNNIGKCEADKKTARDINTGVVENLVKICKVLESHLITLSSEQIFDGARGPYTEDDKPNPVNYYGKSKLAAENVCIIEKIKHTIIRTTGVYGYSSHKKPDFVTSLLETLDSNKEFSAATDQFSNPVYSEDIAQAILKIILKGRTGIYNAGGGEWLSTYEFARKTAKLFGLSDELIKPTKYNEIYPSLHLPVKAGLVNLKSETDLGIRFSNLENGITSYKFQLSEKINSSYMR